MPQLIANNATSTLASSATNVATSLTVQSGDAGLFPSPSAGEYFIATLVDASLNREIVKVTARSGAILTVVRAQENTLARAWNAGDRLSLQMTAGGYGALENPAAISDAVAKTTPADADKFGYWDSVTSKFRALTWANFYEAVRTKLGAMISASGAKSTPVDADQFAISDSAAANGPAKVSWLNLKATMFAAWGALIAAATAKTSPVGADMIEVADSAASNATKKVTLTNLVTALGVIIAALTAKATPIDADGILVVDSAASNVSKWTTLTNFWTNYLKPKALANSIVAVFTPLHNQPPSTNYATLSTRNSEPVLQFDTTTQEGAVFGGVMPYGYAGGSIRVTIWASLQSATSGTLGWLLAFEALSAQDTDADGFASDQTAAAATVPATSGQPMTHQVTFSQAQADALAAGEAFRLRVRRDVANDTATGDAELIRVLVELV